VLGRTKTVHCVGIGGSGVSAVAEVLARSGFEVTGSDEHPSDVTERLASIGIAVHAGHAAEHVGDADVVVVSSAVRPANPEVQEARRRHIPVVLRAEMLAEIMRPKFGIAVAGAHGKTTTTAMIALMLDRAGLDPTALIGAHFGAFGSNTRVGRGEHVVAEADESDRSFLRLTPAIAVITNLDREHLQSYDGFEDLTQAFVEFANRVPFYGAAVVCADDPHVREARTRMTTRVVTYGLEVSDADIIGRDLRLAADSSTVVVVIRAADGRQTRLGELQLQVPGRHTVLNALAAVCVGRELGLDFDTIAAGLREFEGTARRFMKCGEARGVLVIDDYGHHPTEIGVVLDTARRATDGRVIVVFQPHRYSRTQELRDEFAAALSGADEIVLTDIYSSGEDPLPGVTIEWLAEAVERVAPGRVRLARQLEDVPAAVAALVRPRDLVITLGAGSVGQTGPRILDEIGRCP
jgi:UDP-N-acetylmuramate--alanine ligase